MTAPDPTAGEREHDWRAHACPLGDCACEGDDDDAPPAVAASTGTSKDVEALARALRDVGIERGYVGADAIRKHWAERLLASDWLAAREAAARAEALRDALAEWEGGPTGQAPIPRWWLEDRIAREVRP